MLAPIITAIGQGVIKYQVKCLAGLRAHYAGLDDAVRVRVD